MSKTIYRYLTNSLLFDDRYLDRNLVQLSEKELRAELLQYREYCIENLEEIKSEINLYSNHIRVFSPKDVIDVPTLMQTAFYLDQVVLPDKIFEHTQEMTEASKVYAEFSGWHSKETGEINRLELTGAVRLFKELEPMVSAGYLFFFPTSYFFEPSSDIPLTIPTLANGDDEILNYYRKSAQVKSFTSDGEHIIYDKTLEYRRNIDISFDKNDSGTYIQQLLNAQFTELESGKMKMMTSLPKEPPSKKEFETWVSQSIDGSALNHFEKIKKEMTISSYFRSQFITTSSFVDNLFKINTAPDIKSITANCVLNFDLNFYEGISIKDLMSMRLNDGEEFEVFRRELEKHLQSLKGVHDYSQMQSKVEEIVHELTEVEIAKINVKIKHAKKGALTNVAIGAGGLASSFATSGYSLFATMMAGINGYKDYADYQKEVRDNPSYFLWKTKKK